MMRTISRPLLLSGLLMSAPALAEKKPLHALFIPLADHYAAAVVAKEKYGSEMKSANYTTEMMKAWPDLRAKFLAGQADVAFVISPLAMDMYREKGNFKVVSLVHRDGNALALNEVALKKIKLADDQAVRKPSKEIAEAMASFKAEKGEPMVCAVPSLQSTHVLVLHKFLKDNGKSLAIGEGQGDVLAKAVPPPASPDFLKQQAKDGKAACFEQSLPWAEVVETQGAGKVAWFSKDVLKWPSGHVECIMIASDEAIKNKKEALAELISYIHKSGADIEAARAGGGKELDDLAKMINKAIPAHNLDAIKGSLSPKLNVINYSKLDVDKEGLKQVMDLGVDAKVLKAPVDLDKFIDPSFALGK